MDLAPTFASALPVNGGQPNQVSACEPELVPTPTSANHMGFSYVKFG
jgi:hypothetical protein